MRITKSLILEYSKKNSENISKDFKKSEKIIWECSLNHEWISRLDSRVLRNKGCPYCSNQKVWQGFNDAETRLPEFLYLWDHELNSKKPSEVFPSYVAYLKCNSNHHFELSLIKASKMKEPCPYCGKRKAIEGVNDLETLYPKITKNWSKENKAKPSEFLPQSNKVAIWTCTVTEHIHSFTMPIQKRVSGRGCPYCSTPARKVLKGFNDLKSNYQKLCEEWSDKNIKSPSDYLPKSNEKVWWTCNLCSHNWVALIYNRVDGSGCPKCSNSNIVSRGEKELFNFIKENLSEDIEIRSNTRSVITPLELDIYIPGLNIAFEFNGDYWHSNLLMRKSYGSSYNYHLLKYELCKDRGIRLFYVWEGDWQDKRNLVMSRIREVLNDSSLHFNILSIFFKK